MQHRLDHHRPWSPHYSQAATSLNKRQNVDDGDQKLKHEQEMLPSFWIGVIYAGCVSEPFLLNMISQTIFIETIHKYSK